jgi:polyhydroxyalkanoate synthase
MIDRHSMPAASDSESTLQKLRLGMHIMLEGARIETGRTPRAVIWSKNKARLYRYAPTAQKRFAVPILLVYALINRPYILDLLPGSSLVEYLVGQGFDVYLLDWGIPGDEDSDLGFEHYLFDYLARAVKRMLSFSRSREFTLLGYCMGGTMSAMYAALFPDQPLRNLVLLASPIDFTPEATGLYGLWTSARYFNPHQMVEALGNIPGELIDLGNRLVKPVANFVGPYVTMWERIAHDRPLDSWLAVNKWVSDGIPFPGAAFRQWISDFYQQNKLVKGEIELRGRRVDLTHICCPVLVIAGQQDHICTLPQAEAAMRLLGSQDKEFFTLDAGHVGLLTSPNARKKLWPRLWNWLESRSL